MADCTAEQQFFGKESIAFSNGAEILIDLQKPVVQYSGLRKIRFAAPRAIPAIVSVKEKIYAYEIFRKFVRYSYLVVVRSESFH
ncbi:hypothetical protein [Marinococcus luteus]|uniref:hypothetical protein n=1 Tax=Marinococcus luteus TaxID=1122204 RepID=UPI002ACD82A6|nr:hypothetical protein [Marinococcus luteus]